MFDVVVLIIIQKVYRKKGYKLFYKPVTVGRALTLGAYMTTPLSGTQGMQEKREYYSYLDGCRDWSLFRSLN